MERPTSGRAATRVWKAHLGIIMPAQFSIKMAFNPLDPDEQPNSVPHDVKVSVRMSTYNHASYIRQAIEGVLMQRTNFNFELCIGEDDSTDGTREICKEYAARYPGKIRLFLRQAKDKIYVDGRMTGKYNGRKTNEACRGEYQALCEGDDFWIDPLKLQKQVDFLEANKDCNVCATRALVMREVGSSINPPASLTRIDTGFLLHGWVAVNTVTLMYRRSVVANPPDWINNVLSGDWTLLIRLLSDGSHCHIMPDVTAVYRVHSNGLWNAIKRSNYNPSLHVISKLKAYRPAASPAVQAIIDREIRMHTAFATLSRARGLAKVLVAVKQSLCCPGFASWLIQTVRKRVQDRICPEC